jgi:signal transduction histidine kinase
VVEDGTFQRVAVAHADPSHAPIAYALQWQYAPRQDESGSVTRVVRTGRPELIAHVHDAMLTAVARDEEHLRTLRGMRLTSYITVPLVAQERVLGAITFGSAGSGRHYGPSDLALAEELARRAALAVDNARLYREAREANRVKSQFLATMSHELRTPLNAIAGYAELLDLGLHGPVTEEQREALRRIRVNQRHLLGLINDVLSFTRLETGRLEFDIVDVGVEETLSAARAHIEPQIAARELHYEYHPGDPAITCRADRDKLQQIVLNLLTNAVKFTPAGGCITLEWEASPDDVAIRVRDTGRGIPRDKLAMIFEPFVQLDTAFSARFDGAGLGLAISRELARAMDGEVSVESGIGNGSTFTVTMPRG